jgi:hypothetical protein
MSAPRLPLFRHPVDSDDPNQYTITDTPVTDEDLEEESLYHLGLVQDDPDASRWLARRFAQAPRCRLELEDASRLLSTITNPTDKEVFDLAQVMYPHDALALFLGAGTYLPSIGALRLAREYLCALKEPISPGYPDVNYVLDGRMSTEYIHALVDFIPGFAWELLSLGNQFSVDTELEAASYIRARLDATPDPELTHTLFNDHYNVPSYDAIALDEFCAIMFSLYRSATSSR